MDVTCLHCGAGNRVDAGDATAKCAKCSNPLPAVAVALVEGFVYILSNASMPGLLKIGMTERPVEERIAELNSASGVPEPFELEVEFESEQPRADEQRSHAALGHWRHSRKREFFSVDVGEAVRCLVQTLGREPIRSSVRVAALLDAERARGDESRRERAELARRDGERRLKERDERRELARVERERWVDEKKERAELARRQRERREKEKAERLELARREQDEREQEARRLREREAAHAERMRRAVRKLVSKVRVIAKVEGNHSWITGILLFLGVGFVAVAFLVNAELIFAFGVMSFVGLFGAVLWDRVAGHLIHERLGELRTAKLECPHCGAHPVDPALRRADSDEQRDNARGVLKSLEQLLADGLCPGCGGAYWKNS